MCERLSLHTHTNNTNTHTFILQIHIYIFEYNSGKVENIWMCFHLMCMWALHLSFSTKSARPTLFRPPSNSANGVFTIFPDLESCSMFSFAGAAHFCTTFRFYFWILFSVSTVSNICWKNVILSPLFYRFVVHCFFYTLYFFSSFIRVFFPLSFSHNILFFGTWRKSICICRCLCYQSVSREFY